MSPVERALHQLRREGLAVECGGRRHLTKAGRELADRRATTTAGRRQAHVGMRRARAAR